MKRLSRPRISQRASNGLSAAVHVVLILTSRVGATCYHPNGNLVTEPDYVPCNNSLAGPSAPSMCCALNRTGEFPMIIDQCLSNGLCKYQYTEPAGKVITQYWRDGCSSKDWKGDCLDVCGWINNGNTQVTPCASDGNTTRWCCGESNYDCCNNWNNNSSAFEIPLELGGALSSSTSSATVSPPTTSTKPLSSSAASETITGDLAGDQAGASPDHPPTGTIIGVSIGAIAGVVLLAGFAFLLWKRKRTKSEQERQAAELAGGMPHHQPLEKDWTDASNSMMDDQLDPSRHRYGPSELGTRDSRYELESATPGTVVRHELGPGLAGSFAELPAEEVHNHDFKNPPPYP